MNMLKLPEKLVLASNNAGKLKELSLLLSPFNVNVLAQSEFNIADADETGLSFIENALIKARHASKISGLAALADDSGLCVTALNGAPGIQSARYSGGGDSENNQKLLAELSDETDRSAHFVCALALVTHWQDPTPTVVCGQWCGEILRAPQGDFGFGYDPVFWVPTHGCAAAQLSKEQKSAISHRAIALQKLLAELKAQ
ncbi:XTP/dITP diphosphatase [Sessilibacter sp. MAH2]